MTQQPVLCNTGQGTGTDRRITGLLLIAAPTVLALGSVMLCPGGSCTIPAIDQAGMALAVNLQHLWLSGLMSAVTWAGSLWLLAPLALAHAILALRRQHFLAALLAPLALLGATALAQAFKWWTDRPRPVDLPLVSLPPDPSFPSAHAMQITALVVVLLGAGRSPAVWLLAAALIGVVGFSRIYLQVHFLTDVAFGTLAALFWGLALRRIFQTTGATR